ncbi:MAG: universal stress protein [Planctomycetaceae bacterium]|nr:universal stress protein [Planctomycetaceae bacterium]
MIRIEKILFPTDFSPATDGAREMAIELARQFDAELHLLHIMEDLAARLPEFGMGLALPAFVADSQSRLKDYERQAIAQLTAITPDGTGKLRRAVIAIKEGRTFEQVNEYAKSHQIDLIVMGTHGRSGLAHVLMGSVAERVVQHAACPVLTVRPKDFAFEMP